MEHHHAWGRVCCTTPSRTHGYLLEELGADFGEEVAHLVAASPSWTRSSWAPPTEAETIRKMVVASGADLARVLVISCPTGCTTCARCASCRRRSRPAKARETLEVFAPLAPGSHGHGQVGAGGLAFRACCTRRSTTRSPLVADRAPSRDTTLRQVIEERERQLDGAAASRRPWRPVRSQFTTRSPQNDRKGKDSRRLHTLVGVRILVDDVRDWLSPRWAFGARAVEPMACGSRTTCPPPPPPPTPLTARFGFLPVAAHHVIRPGRKPLEGGGGGGGADRDARHASARASLTHRGALGATRRPGNPHRQAVEVRRDGLVDAHRLLDWQRRRRTRGSSSSAALRPWPPGRSSCSRRRGDVGHAGPSGSTPWTSLRGATPSRAAGAVGFLGFNGGWSPWSASWRTARVRRDLHSKAGGAGPARTGCRSWPPRGPRRRSGTGSQRNAARGHRVRGKERSPGGPAYRDAPAAARLGPTRWPRWPESCTTRPVRAVRAVGENHASASTWWPGWSRLLGGVEDAEESSPSGPRRTTVQRRRGDRDSGRRGTATPAA